MPKRYDSASHAERLNTKLEAYSKAATSLTDVIPTRTISRSLARAALASVVPLAAGAGDVAAQCVTGPPTGTVTLNSSNNSFFIFMQPTSLAVAVVFDYTNSDLFFTGVGGVSIFGATGGGFFALAFSPSLTVTPTGSLGVSATGCDAGSNGAFCGGGSGAMAIRNSGDGRLGWIELSVSSLDNTEAVLVLGDRGFQPVAGPTIHPGDCSSLPVELVRFDALVDDGGVAMTWETASELNNAGFEVQRASRFEGFRKVAFVAGKGTTADAQVYRFVDETAAPNTHYQYRLKQIDLDGTTSFSEVVEVFTSDPSQIALSEFYPNPAGNGRVTLELRAASDLDAAVDVYDIRGAQVDSRTRRLNAGENRLTFATEGLAAGTHFARIQVGERTMYRQFVVSR